MNSLPSYDLARLLQASAACSLITSVGVAPSYNLPIALYGLFATSSENGEHARTLTVALAGSIAADVLWLFAWSHATRSLVVLILLANMGIKVVSLLTLQTSGARDSFSTGAGWSMPGSFGHTSGQSANNPSTAQPASYQGAYSFAADDDDEEEDHVASSNTASNQQQKATGAGYQAV